MTNIKKHEESALAFFLSIPKYKNGSAKELYPLYQSVMALGNPNTHKLWVLVNEVSSIDEAKSLTRLFKQVEQEMKINKLSSQDALKKVLDHRVSTVRNQDLADKLKTQVDGFFRENCYF